MRITIVMVLAGFVLGGCHQETDPISNIDNTSSGIDTPGAVGAVTLSWYPPTQNQDGSPLLDLAGYNIYIGRESSVYQQNIQIDNPGLTTYVIENLSAGTYYVTATAINSSGIESEFSGEVIVNID